MIIQKWSDCVDRLCASWRLTPLAAVSASVQSSLLLRIKETCVNLKTIQFAKNSKCKEILDFSKYYGDDYQEDYGAFENCRSLTSLTLSDSLQHISCYSLDNCSALKAVLFGSEFVSVKFDLISRMTESKSFSYEGLSNLTTLKISSKNKTYSSSNGILFNKAKTKLIWFPQNKSENTYTVPAKVKEIQACAFQYNRNLVSLNLSSV